MAAHLNAGHSGGNSVAIGIYSPSSHTSIPLPPILPVPNKLMVSVDVTRYVYLLKTLERKERPQVTRDGTLEQ